MRKNVIIGILAFIAIGLFIYSTSVNNTRLVSQLSVSEQLETASIDQTVSHERLDEIVNFRPTSDTVTTDVDNVYSATLTDGSSIDLTDLTNTLGDAMDLTDERVVAVKFKNSAESGTISISEGTDGYPLFGASFSLDLEPNQSVLYKCDTALTNVDASNKEIDYSLDGATLDVILISAELY